MWRGDYNPKVIAILTILIESAIRAIIKAII